MARYFIRTPRESLLNRYVAYLSESAEQHHAAVSFSDRSVLIADLSEEEAQAALEAGATLYEDIQFDAAAERNLFLDLEARVQFQDSTTPQATSGSAPVPPAKSLATVLDHIKAPAAWAQSRGAGVTIAIVDSGICPTLMEVPPARRSPISLSTAYAGAHWVNGTGHGAMCAVIAAGSADAGGRYNGVAPEATVLSARSTLLASDLYRIYDELRILKAANVITGPLVISNSTALSACSAPMRIPRDHPFLQLVELLVAEGIVVVFAAGNSHADLFCRNDPAQCGPNSIWAMNSLDVVLTVGAVNEANTNQDPATPHANSSRGPGQWAVNYPKPDCVAPTYGEVAWGCGYVYKDWWGTSGACPQVAGLAALMLSKNPALTPQQVGDIVRATCVDIGAHPHCVGRGLIDCQAAVAAV